MLIMPCSKPYPLGATLCGEGCNFSIYAPGHNNLLLALFGEDDQYTTHPLNNDYAGILHTHIKGVKAGQKYGFIVEHPDGDYLISDPYAKAIEKPPHYMPPLTPSKSFQIAKSVVIDSNFDWQGVEKPIRAKEEMVLFETHVKGLTKLNPEVESLQQGCYLGLVSEAMITFYKQQNINTLQLLPIAACMHEPHLLESELSNYWGYNPYVFMAPDPRFADTDAVHELKSAIRELHRHDIEVILDVVYNHTAEGGSEGAIFNLKALDDNYYLKHDDKFANFTGCGNTLDLSYQPTLNLVMDSLRYWAVEYQVDGFRFDLAATLGREGDIFNSHSAFFKAVAQDPILKQVKLIAEPWDIGPNGYQVGQFPVGWNECNDRLRDITRSFWRGDQGYLKEFTTRLMGSRDLYSAANWPHNLTVNYITYHDGFTLQDLVSYRQKHNLANGEENRDGHGDNRSDNYGIEGETDNPAIVEKREKQKRNFMASLLFSFGIPHMLTADILSHSQNGNNNAYCQDNELSWLNWQPSQQKDQFKQWMSHMVEARQHFMLPLIKAFSGKQRHNNKIEWRRVDGTAIEHDDWNTLNAVSLRIGLGEEGNEMFYCINQTNAPARFTLPDDRMQCWITICDTHSYDIGKIVEGKQFLATPRSIVIMHAVQ